MAAMLRRNKFSGPGYNSCHASVNDFGVFRSAIIAYDLLSGRFPGLETGGVVGVIATILAGEDDECNVCIAELCKFVGILYHPKPPSA